MVQTHRQQDTDTGAAQGSASVTQRTPTVDPALAWAARDRALEGCARGDGPEGAA
jgi:hypothetical protein